jgi:hypothetical protein
LVVAVQGTLFVVSWTRVATVCLIFETLLIAGCSWSAHSTTLVREGSSAGQVIYCISEETAFTTALDAYAVLYPKQSVDDIVDGDRRGYIVDENWGADRWRHRLLVIPALGTDPSGNEVRGYWYAYSGSGTLSPTAERIAGLLRLIRMRLDTTGTAVVVTNLRDGKYETDGRAYLGLKRDARDIRPGVRLPEGKRNP